MTPGDWSIIPSRSIKIVTCIIDIDVACEKKVGEKRHKVLNGLSLSAVLSRKRELEKVNTEKIEMEEESA